MSRSASIGVLLAMAVSMAGCGPDDRTHSISGKTLAYVRVELSGTRSAVTMTDHTRNYRFTDLPEGTYTITASGEDWGYELTPASRQVTVAGEDVSGQDFTLYALACEIPFTTCEPEGSGLPPACAEPCGAYCYSGMGQSSVEVTFWYDSATRCVVAVTSLGDLQIYSCNRGPPRFVIPSCGGSGLSRSP